jgi:hypothetical protein
MKPILCLSLIALAALAGCTSHPSGVVSSPSPSLPHPAPGATTEPQGVGHTESFNGTEYLSAGIRKPDGSSTSDVIIQKGAGYFPVDKGASKVVVQATWVDPTNQLDWRFCLTISGFPLNETQCETGPSPLSISLENQTGILQAGRYFPLLFAPSNLPNGMGASFNVKIDWSATVTYRL